jgi:hypothetical protein
MDIALNSKRDDWNNTSKEGNEYNRVNTDNNIDINSRVNMDENSSTSNNFGNNTYKLIFKGIKSWNWKCTINILYRWSYEQLMIAVELFRKILRAKPNISL